MGAKNQRMGRPRVPVEVAERIINFLALDVKTLRSCALACRSWNPRSCYHLFYSVAVSTEPDQSPDALVRLFQRHPEIPSLVHSVTVNCFTGTYMMAIDRVHDVAVIVLLPYLPHLTRWRFKGQGVFAFSPMGLMCLARYSCIESLQLRRLWLRSGDLSKIISSLPRLTDLDCNTCDRVPLTTHDGGGHNNQVAARRFPRKANIRHFTVSSFYYSHFIAAT